MDSHSIGARPSATTENNATKLSNDTRPASGPSRRAMLAGMAALPLSACPAPAPAHAVGVCAKMAELIDVARDAMAEHDAYRTTVYDPCEEREVSAHTAGGPACPIPADVARRHDGLLDAVTFSENQVIDFPATTIADLHAKIAFMVDRGLFGFINASATLLADAARLAGVEA